MSRPGTRGVEIVGKLNKDINAALADLGSVPLSMMPADFGKLIADETEKWAEVVISRGSSRSDLRTGRCLVECFLDSNHIEGSMQVRVSLMKRHLPARQHMIGFKESLN